MVAAYLSRRIPARIICCSQATARTHGLFGYATDRLVVIPNGFETAKRINDAGVSVRTEFGLEARTLLVGRVGRDHPQKDTRSLLAAFASVRRRVAEARLVLVGEGFTNANKALRRDLAASGLGDGDVVLAGVRGDVARFNSAFDVAVSSSYSEALPVVLGEAMSVETPVVATDVGDSASLVHDAERIVPPRDPDALADAIVRVLRLDHESRRWLGRRDQERVRSEFAFSRMCSAYENVYETVLSHAG